MSTIAESTQKNVPRTGMPVGSASGEPVDAIDRLAPHEDGPSVQPPCDPDAEMVGLHVSAVVDGLVDGSVEEIDGLIAALQMLRDQVDADARRVRGELNVLAHVGHSAMQTTTVLGEALGRWRGAGTSGE
jgi:hypothetical protein